MPALLAACLAAEDQRLWYRSAKNKVALCSRQPLDHAAAEMPLQHEAPANVYDTFHPHLKRLRFA